MKVYLGLLIFIGIAPSLSAQELRSEPLQKNYLKFNVTSIFVKNYSLQYERIVNKKFSAALSFRAMPTTSLPLKRFFIDSDTDPDTRNAVENLRINNIAITPEIRWYVSKKGYGRGFYIAPFYRFASFKTSTLTVQYLSGAGNAEEVLLMGKLNSHTGGILFGAQWMLSKRISLDWWILGPHYGKGEGDFSGTPSTPLTQQEQDDLRQALEDLDIPLTNKKIAVSATRANLGLSGPYGGIRSGLLLGIRF